MSAGQTLKERALPHPAFPPSALQNVETFGSLLGQEIVSNWRRSLERTILSQAGGEPPAAQHAKHPAAGTKPALSFCR